MSAEGIGIEVSEVENREEAESEERSEEKTEKEMNGGGNLPEQGGQAWQEAAAAEKDDGHMERKSDKIKADKIRKDKIKADRIRTDEMKTDKIKADEIKAEFEYEDIEFDKKQGKKAYRITGTMTAKVIAYFLLVVSCFVGLCGGCMIVGMQQMDVYTLSEDEVLQDILYDAARSIAYRVQGKLSDGDEGGAEAICQEHNIDLELIKAGEGKREFIWGTWSGYDTDLVMETTIYFGDEAALRNIVLNGHKLKAHEAYIFRIYFDTRFPIDDNLKKMAELVPFMYQARFWMIGVAVGSLFLCFVCFIFLMCSAGHRKGYEGIVPGVLTHIHLDILALIFGSVFLVVIHLIGEMNWDRSLLYILLAMILFTFLVFCGVVFLTDIAIRMKKGKMLRHTLVFEVLCLLGRGIRFLGKGMLFLGSHISSAAAMIGIWLGICIFELIMFVMTAYGDGEIALFFWAMEKLALLAIALYVTFNYKQLQQAGEALAEGCENYVVDTSKMVGDFKRHGENLNSIGRGISKAVAERMKSEHLKTELITNVSHDLKTPLTSIINYANLIYEEVADVPGGDASVTVHSTTREYAEVLLRQSGRLKKLLEDLVEASKATTGNLEVNLESCQAGVILSQAVGEYEKRMEERGLRLIVRQPQEPVNIIADGRHLWRVFDNLLNNICKYAQDNSRVYLSVETKDEYVRIIFRNMSKYPLELSAEELQERFIRGDKSRHMEGNGLGLSIAGSLMELQDGKMDIMTDGDLFKVILQLGRDYSSESTG